MFLLAQNLFYLTWASGKPLTSKTAISLLTPFAILILCKIMSRVFSFMPVPNCTCLKLKAFYAGVPRQWKRRTMYFGRQIPVHYYRANPLHVTVFCMLFKFLVYSILSTNTSRYAVPYWLNIYFWETTSSCWFKARSVTWEVWPMFMMLN